MLSFKKFATMALWRNGFSSLCPVNWSDTWFAVINCPFRGCAGDWVKLGVAKRHGAVLGDAVSKMADENTKVQLVESDIPGAELPKPAEFCTVAILKRWLSCRGAKVSGNRMSFSYKRLTLASLGKVWNFFSGEFLQLFVHPGTQQLNLPILHLTTSTKTQGNEEFKQMASPKTAPWCFATPNLTQSPAQPRNGHTLFSRGADLNLIPKWD